MTNITLNGILFNDLTIFTANSVILASKLTHKIPEVIPNLFRSALSYTSLICLPFQFNDFKKNISDLSHAVRLKSLSTIAHVALKISLRVLEIFLIIAGSIAVFLMLTPLAPISPLIFQTMIPFAIPGLLLPIAIDGIDAYEDRRLLKLLENNIVLQKVTKAVRKNLELNKPPKEKITLDVLKQFSLLTLDQLSKEISEESLKTALKTRLMVSKMDLGLKGLGQMAIAIGRIYPNSLAQAASIWTLSVLYNLKHFFERKTFQSWLHRGKLLLGKIQSTDEE